MHRKALIIKVENIGVEPMTSSPKAFGACKRLVSRNEPFDIFTALFLFDLIFSAPCKLSCLKCLLVNWHPIISF